MKILVIFFTPFYAGLDGAQRRFVHVVRHWERLHDLVVLEPYPGLVRRFNLPFRSEEIEIRELGTHRFGSNAIAHLEWMRKAQRKAVELCRREKFDLVLVPVHTYSLLKPAMHVKRKFDIPVLTVAHAPERAELEARLPGMYRIGRAKGKGKLGALLWALSNVRSRTETQNSDAVLTVSHASARNIEKMGVPAERILVSFNGVSIDEIDAAGKGVGQGFEGVFLARLIPEKGIFDLMHIWGRVCRTLPSARLAVFGSGQEKHKRQMLEIAQEHGMAENLRFFGFTPDEELFPILKSSKLYIFPSWGEAEGWPLSPGEAMACGMPVVAYDIPAMREAYGAAESVHLVGVRNVQAMAEEALKLLQNEPERRRQAGISRAFAEKMDWREVSRTDDRLIREFFAAGKRPRQPSSS